MGHARLDGGIVILLASMAWESYFEYLELDSRLMWIVWLEQNRRSLENTGWNKSIEPSVPTSITLAQFCYPNPPFHYPRSTTLMEPGSIVSRISGLDLAIE